MTWHIIPVGITEVIWTTIRIVCTQTRTDPKLYHMRGQKIYNYKYHMNINL